MKKEQLETLLFLAVVGGAIYYFMHRKYMKKNCKCKDSSNGDSEANGNNSAYSGLDNAQYEVEGVAIQQFDDIGYDDPSAQFAQEALNATQQQQMMTQPVGGITPGPDFAEVSASEGGFKMY